MRTGATQDSAQADAGDSGQRDSSHNQGIGTQPAKEGPPQGDCSCEHKAACILAGLSTTPKGATLGVGGQPRHHLGSQYTTD